MMQMQTYVSQDEGRRIVVPSSNPITPTPSPIAPAPSVVSIFAREIWKRKWLLFFWLILTAGAAAAVVMKYAKPLYRAEGRLSYKPNHRSGIKPLYNPPNIQTVLQILRDPDVVDPIRDKYLPEETKIAFANRLKIEIFKQSEYVDISFDHPDPQIAKNVANEVIQRATAHFEKYRQTETQNRLTELTAQYEKAAQDLRKSQGDLHQETASRGIADLKTEIDTTRISISDTERSLRDNREKEERLKLGIQHLIKERDKPADPSDTTLDETFFPRLQALAQQLETMRINQKDLGEAEAKYDYYAKEEARMRALVQKGVLPQSEYDLVVQNLKIAKSTIDHHKNIQKDQEELKKRYEELKSKAIANKPQRKTIIDELERDQKELATIPATISSLTKEHKEKQKALEDLFKLQRTLLPKEEEIELLKSRHKELDAQINDSGRDLNANDLSVTSNADTGSTPYSTNAPKLALGIVAVSALIFLSFIGLFAFPQLSHAHHQAIPGNELAAIQSESNHPRGIVALVPVPTPSLNTHASSSNGHHSGGPISLSEPTPSKTPPMAKVPPANEVIAGLARRIEEEGADQGGIVLFAPTAERLHLSSVVSELGKYFTSQGSRVLIFDARSTAEAASWIPASTQVSKNIAGYLDGKIDAESCFVSTSLEGVDYTKADLASMVSGVISARRFRQLVEEIRERYPLVLMIAPPVSTDGNDPFLAALVEGIVLVAETNTPSSKVQSIVDELGRNLPTPVYGTLVVPKLDKVS
jgi:capsular polysaccharide biosynthesis protein